MSDEPVQSEIAIRVIAQTIAVKTFDMKAYLRGEWPWTKPPLGPVPYLPPDPCPN